MRSPAPQAFQDNYPSPYLASSPSPHHPPTSPYSSASYTNSQEVITVEEEEEEPLGWLEEAAQLPQLPASITMTRVNQVRYGF